MRTHPITFWLATVSLLASGATTAQTPARITAPVEWREDFDEGHISGWESYPPFQDSAFDPDFKCSREDNMPGSRYALTRRVQIGFPTEYEIGFIRRIGLDMTESSTVSFSYLLKMFGDANRLEIVLCGSNGRKYGYTIPRPENNRWQTVRIPAASFKDTRGPLLPGEVTEAVYVLAYVDRMNSDAAYRFYLDNVAITGAAPVHFEVLTPEATVLEHWDKTVLRKHYAAGAALHLTVSVPPPVTLTSVRFSLCDPHGAAVRDGIPLSFDRERKVWEHPALYTFSQQDEKGRWRGKLRGEDGRGGHIETQFDVWVTERSQPHPRMYVGADNIDFYERRLKDPKWKSWFDTLATKAARLEATSNLGSIAAASDTSSFRFPAEWTLQSIRQVDLSVYDTTYLLPTLGHYYGVIYPAMEILYGHALLYALTGDRDIGEYARNALLAIAGWESWTHPWFRARHQESYYPVGELGVRAAFCYDIVHHLLSPTERRIVRDGLLRNCVLPVYREYVVENRIPSSTSNWIGNSVSGALSSILAMYGDSPDDGDFEPYLSGLLTKLEDHLHSTLDTSGAWGEGTGYQSFAFSNILPTATALTRVLRADIITPALLRSYLYFLYNTSSAGVLDVGDSHPTLGTLSYFAWMSSKTDDPLFRWLYLMGPRDHVLDFLFGRDDGPVAPPDTLPKSRLFTEIGGAVFRSGWNPDDVVMSFRCGPFYNHQHFDQGSFQLSAFGETLVPEAGVVHYYNDPWYQSYYIQAVGHNTVLLDGNPGSQRSGDYLHFVRAAADRAEMKEFVAADYYGAATGELHRLYRGNLNLFERNVIFMQPDYFVVFDRLRSSGMKHEYDWLLHFDDRKDVKVSGHDITVERRQASLLVKVLAPENALIEMKRAPVRLGVPITQPGFVQVRNVGKSTGENFLVVLFPAKRDPNSGTPGTIRLTDLSDEIRPMKGSNFVGVRVARGDVEDEILFRIDDSKDEIHDSRVATDGRMAARSVQGDSLRLLAVHEATSCAYHAVRGDTPFAGLTGTMRFTAAGTFHGNTSEWEIQVAHAGTIRFHSVRKPLEVRYNGQMIPSLPWDNENRHFAIPVAKGRNTLTIRF